MPSENREPLIASAIAGDRSAQEQLLIEHYERLIYRVQKRLNGKLATQYAAEDVLQEALVLAIRDFNSCRATNQAELGAWLNAVVDNRMRDIRKRVASAKRGGERSVTQLGANARSSIVGLLEILEQDDRSPSSRIARADAIKALQIGIASLPPEQREAVERRLLEGTSLGSVADQMNRTPAAVRALIHRAKQALRGTMGKSSRWFNKK